MINPVSQNINTYSTPNFCGKTISRKNCEEIYDVAEKFIKKGSKKFQQHGKTSKQSPTFENYQAYATNVVKTSLCLEKTNYGYKFPSNSIGLKKYIGTWENGLSTEGGGYGGGWIVADLKAPLSTKDVHTCALLNLIDEKSGKQLLYHVYHDTGPIKIQKLINENFPNFTKVNIMPGDMPRTNLTVKNILEAVDSVNSKATKNYYHLNDYESEIIANDGKLSYIKSPGDSMAFETVSQYWY